MTTARPSAAATSARNDALTVHPVAVILGCSGSRIAGSLTDWTIPRQQHVQFIVPRANIRLVRCFSKNPERCSSRVSASQAVEPSPSIPPEEERPGLLKIPRQHLDLGRTRLEPDVGRRLVDHV